MDNQINIELCRTVDRFFRKNDLASAASYLESLLRAETSDRFVSLADRHFTNTPQSVLKHLNAFIKRCGKEFDIKSVYLEMNGFDINYDRWYFDSFGYSNYGDDPDDLEWLCDWSSPEWKQLNTDWLGGRSGGFSLVYGEQGL